MGAVVNEEAFCLKWNDFHTSLTSTFTEIRAESDLLDATIVCEGQALRAHKLVLSASSGVFRQLFRTNNGLVVSPAEPVIMLWDIKADDLKLLLNFMYEGEVNVAQDNLNSFLALAERLQVRGLTSNNRTANGQMMTSRPLVNSSRSGTKRPRTDDPDQGLTIKEELAADGEHHQTQPSNAMFNNASSTTTVPSFNSQYAYYEGDQQNELRQPEVANPGDPGSFATTVPPNAAHHVLAADSAEGDFAAITHAAAGIVDPKGIVAVLNSTPSGLVIPAHSVTNLQPVTGSVPATSSTSSDSSTTSSTSTNGGRPSATSSATSSSSQNNSGTCMHCNKTFRQLRSHIQDVHCPTPTPCPLCGKVFSSKHKMFGHKYRSCPNRTRNLVRHLQDLEQQPGHQQQQGEEESQQNQPF